MLPELASYLERIEDLRGQIGDLIGSLPADALNWRPIAQATDHAMNSLAVLATHVAGAEHFWIGEVIGGLPATRRRDSEFVTEVTAATELVERLSGVGQETRAVLSQLAAADLDGSRQVQERSVPVRWAILHVIDHTALHLGHMQITYQLWAGP